VNRKGSDRAAEFGLLQARNGGGYLFDLSGGTVLRGRYRTVYLDVDDPNTVGHDEALLPGGKGVDSLTGVLVLATILRFALEDSSGKNGTNGPEREMWCPRGRSTTLANLRIFPDWRWQSRFVEDASMKSSPCCPRCRLSRFEMVGADHLSICPTYPNCRRFGGPFEDVVELKA